MKSWTLLALSAALAFAGAALAATNPHEQGAAPSVAAESTYAGVGVVRKVDAAEGRLTLQHEAIAPLGWPAMTMAFQVKDAKLLAGLAPGKKVRFAFVQQGASYVITALE